MPNWIEGCMKVRGKRPDVVRFFENNFEKSSSDVYAGVEYGENGARIKLYDDYYDIEVMNGSYLKGSRRAFVFNGGMDLFLDKNADSEISAAIPIRQAWCFDPEYYKSLSDEYDLDVRCIGWEMGMNFKQEVECLRGQDQTDTVTEYDDWEWETEVPFFGG